MRESFKKFLNTVREWWADKAKGVRILLLGGLAVVLIASLFIVMMINRTDYIILYDDRTTAENASILMQLQEMGIESKLEGSRILIPEKHKNRAMMQIAMTALPAPGPRYDTYALGGGLTATQQDKDRYGRWQDQEDLAAMIRTFPEVRDVHVTITLPETSLFVVQSNTHPPRVAIKIQKMPGRSLSAEQVQGIMNLVLHSVPGLEPENVSIVDEAGDMKSLLGGDGIATKLNLTEEINETIRRRVTEMLIPVYGPEGVVVRVNSILDTDNRKTISTQYELPDPENPERAMINYFEEEYQRQAQGPIVQGVPGANDNVNVPQYSAEIGDDGNGAYYHHHRIYDYLYSSTVTEIEKQGLEIIDMSMAILIDDSKVSGGLSGSKLDEIANLSSRASGIMDLSKISVQSFTFMGDEVEDDALANQLNGLGLIIAIIFGTLALFVIILVLVLMSRKKKREDEEAFDVIEYDEDPATLVSLLANREREEEFEPIQLAETQEQKLKAQIKDLADTDPEIVAQLIKTWLLSA